ncbi:hypothetical protein I7104_005123 [Vibrio parahaemolyticus]|nr:hypothetical protein [Vibrio parahaemolyticus]
MRITSDFENQVLISQAKRESLLKRFFESASEKEKETFIESLFQLHSLLNEYLMSSNRFSIILDTNIIQDILSSNENRFREIRYIATSSILYFLEDYAGATISLRITPTVLYELNNQKPISNISQYNNAMSIVEEAAIKLGISTNTIGFRNYKELKNVTKLIDKDSNNIKKAVEKLAAQDWTMSFDREDGSISIPMAVAENLIPEIKLYYLSPFYVKWALMNFVEKRMFDQNKKQPKARNMMNRNKDGLSKLFKIKSKGDLMGLADIELLSMADLTSQCSSNSIAITSAITYDKDLFKSLSRRLGSVHNGGKFESGKDSPEDAALLFVYQMKKSQQRTKSAEARHNFCMDAFKSFLDENVSSYFKETDT